MAPTAMDLRTPFPQSERGPIVARERPTASDVAPPMLRCLDGGKTDGEDAPLLTRAEARALRRTERLTHADLARHLDGVNITPPQPA